ncbi:MAG: benzoate-CoA ligase family protein [Deltaproteobacteria bacterium]|nr:benzoate-CoA ligase family protein [Deltaproteobacteria bacterium]
MTAYNAAVDLLERNDPDRLAVIDDDGRYTYGDVAARAAKAAGALAALGVQPEQRVALCMLDSVDWIATFLGAIWLGAVPVPLNTLLTAEDYRYLIADSRARVVIASEPLLGKLPPGAIPQATWRQLVATAPAAPVAQTSRDEVAFWLYSSGSTGKPKGAMHLHGSLIATAELYAQPILGIRRDDVVYSAAKLFFAYGLGNSLTFPFSVGATVMLRRDRPTPALVSETLKQGVTIFCGVPTLFAALLADPALEATPTLRVSTSAGEALPRHVGERWRAKMGSDILDGIGSTEMLHIFLSNRPDDVAYGTTGRPVPGYDLELRGDDGGPVADGEEGSLWVRGPTACIGYWNDRTRSLSTFHGPWTRSGDRYIRDAAGRWTYCGRADDMLKVGGIWVSPFEVESALAAHDAVLEAAVVGHDDADGLTKPKAFVVLKPGAAATPAELQAFVKTRLAPYKYPRWVELVGELPKTATGKIQRYKLRG